MFMDAIWRLVFGDTSQMGNWVEEDLHIERVCERSEDGTSIGTLSSRA